MRVNRLGDRGGGCRGKGFGKGKWRGKGFFFFFSELPFTVGRRRTASDSALSTTPDSTCREMLTIDRGYASALQAILTREEF